MTKGNTLIFDTASTGFFNDGLPYSDAQQPKLVAISAILEDADRNELDRMCLVVKLPKGYSVNDGAFKYHGISTEYARTNGTDAKVAVERFIGMMAAHTERTVSFNSPGHVGVIQNSAFANKLMGLLSFPPPEDFCLMRSSVDAVKMPGRDGSYAWPKFGAAYKKATGLEFKVLDAQTIEDALMQKLEAIRTVYHWLLDTVPNMDKPKDVIP